MQPHAELFLWHLDSFSAKDNNYDIYRMFQIRRERSGSALQR
jgi:hypothetical protein